MPQVYVGCVDGCFAGLRWLSGGIAGKLTVMLVWWIGCQSLTGRRGVSVLRLRLECAGCVVGNVGGPLL